MTIITKEHIQKLSQGDEAVFKSIFDDFYPRLVGLAMKYVHDLMVSEDLASEVFNKIWE